MRGWVRDMEVECATVPKKQCGAAAVGRAISPDGASVPVPRGLFRLAPAWMGQPSQPHASGTLGPEFTFVMRVAHGSLVPKICLEPLDWASYRPYYEAVLRLQREVKAFRSNP